MCGDSYMHAGTIAEATHLALWAEQGVGQEHQMSPGGLELSEEREEHID